MLIVIEGLDGSGKATQAGKLAAALANESSCVVKKVTFPDYESQSSSLIKMYLAGEFGSHPDDVNAYAASSFFAVDRYASYKKDWQEEYQSGIVIADRYTTSNAIHQCSKLPEEQWPEFLDWLFDYEYKKLGIPSPDLVIYLQVTPEVSQSLLKKRYQGDMSKEDIHEKDHDYLLRCRKAADYCSDRFGWIIVVCDRNGQMRSIEDISEEIRTIVRRTGGRGGK